MNCKQGDLAYRVSDGFTPSFGDENLRRIIFSCDEFVPKGTECEMVPSGEEFTIAEDAWRDNRTGAGCADRLLRPIAGPSGPSVTDVEKLDEAFA